MTTTTTDPVILATTIIDAVNAGDLETAAAHLHPDYRAEWPDATLDGDQAFEREIAMFTGLPDTRFTVERATALADGRVLLEAMVTGTHTGPLALPHDVTLAATGREIRLPFLFLMTFADGLLHFERLAFDHLELIHQLGATPGS